MENAEDAANTHLSFWLLLPMAWGLKPDCLVGAEFTTAKKTQMDDREVIASLKKALLGSVTLHNYIYVEIQAATN